MDTTTFAIIIPARYASTRFPGKPLALLGDKPIIQHVYERAQSTGYDVYVATDDKRIMQCVTDFGGKAVMTSENHKSGTDRIREAVDNLGISPDVVINIQGDEPFIDPKQIEALAKCFTGYNDTQIATLAAHFDKSRGFEAIFDPNLVKVAFNNNGNALYFSRSIIPYVRSVEWKQWLDNADFYTHIGVYAYRLSTLRELTALPQSSLEKAESLEQLRWLQNGYPIRVAITESHNIGIDTPADLEEAQRILENNNK
jgi:3-deoxy-manno-octulosonate cytidylyltransferase (CMP-KDO synthetase)